MKFGIDFKRATTWIVILFLVIFVLMLAKEAKSETTMEIAPTMFVAGYRYQGATLLFEERWGKYAVGLGLTTTWDCMDHCGRGNGKTNQLVYLQRIVEYKKFELGLGISYWHNTSPSWDSHTPFALSMGWNFNDHWSLKERHFSTGGSSDKNGGLDMLTVGYRF